MTALLSSPSPAQLRSKVVHGDCLELMPRLRDSSVDFVLTDPPYLVDYRDRTGRTVPNDDRDDWLVPAFAEIARVLKPDRFCVSFYGWNALPQFFAAWTAAGLRPIGHLVWAKAYASNRRGFLRRTHESAFLLALGQPAAPALRLNDVLPWGYSGNGLHPTQKPVTALEPLVEAFSAPGDIVLDPFAGSASTGVAALHLGRHFLGFELDEAYAATAQQRLMRWGA